VSGLGGGVGALCVLPLARCGEAVQMKRSFPVTRLYACGGVERNQVLLLALELMF
jgi:hypothetical protein